MEESLQELLTGSFERKAWGTPSVLRVCCFSLGRNGCTPWGPFKALSITPFTSQQAPVAIQGGGPEVLAIPLLIYPSLQRSSYALPVPENPLPSSPLYQCC